jgi:hypothetical protein
VSAVEWDESCAWHRTGRKLEKCAHRNVVLDTYTCRQGREFTFPTEFGRSAGPWYFQDRPEHCECWLKPGQCYLDDREGHVRRGLMLSSEVDWDLLPESCRVDPDQVAWPANAVRETELLPRSGIRVEVVLSADALGARCEKFRSHDTGYWSYRFRAMVLKPVRQVFLSPGMVVSGEWTETGMSTVSIDPGREFTRCKRGLVESALRGAGEEEVLEQVRSLRHLTRFVDVRYYRKDRQQPPVDVGGFLVEM